FCTPPVTPGRWATIATGAGHLILATCPRGFSNLPGPAKGNDMSQLLQTLAEAENFLWNALNHVSGLILCRRPPANEQACAILRHAIDVLQNEQSFEEMLESHPLITPEVREIIRREREGL